MMENNTISDTEKIERWNIANTMKQIHTSVLHDIDGENIAHYTGGMVDDGDLNYARILGFKSFCSPTIEIEKLREIIQKLNIDDD